LWTVNHLNIRIKYGNNLIKYVEKYLSSPL
jgi:hypothetical protein